MIKSKDLTLILVVVGIAAMLAFFVSNLLFKADDVRTTVEVVSPISSDFPALPETVFNENALNPTQEITIGDGNPAPFQQTEGQ